MNHVGERTTQAGLCRPRTFRCGYFVRKGAGEAKVDTSEGTKRRHGSTSKFFALDNGTKGKAHKHCQGGKVDTGLQRLTLRDDMLKGGEHRQAKTPLTSSMSRVEPRARRPEARATCGEPLQACLPAIQARRTCVCVRRRATTAFSDRYQTMAWFKKSLLRAYYERFSRRKRWI